MAKLIVDTRIYCITDRHVLREPDPRCDHNWKQVKNEDTYGAWECDHCHGYIEIGVWQ